MSEATTTSLSRIGRLLGQRLMKSTEVQTLGELRMRDAANRHGLWGLFGVSTLYSSRRV